MTEVKRPLKVFLCHASTDKPAVRDLYLRLKKDGVDAWLDKEKLLPGQDWEYEIRKAVREADVVVVCLSKQFNQAGFRQKEVRLALDTAMEKPEGEIFIIPARLEECDTLESLRKWHWVDLFNENGYFKLLKSLNKRAKKIKFPKIELPEMNDLPFKSQRKEDNEIRHDVSLGIGGNSEGTIVIGDNNIVQLLDENQLGILQKDLEIAKQKYLSYIIETNQYIDPRGIMQTRRSVSLKLDEVYVLLDADNENSNFKFNSMFDGHYDTDDGKDDDLVDLISQDAELYDLGRAVLENKQIVILGDPGAGKTTLMRFLALQFASSLINEKDEEVKDKDNANYGFAYFPILLRVSNYASVLSQDKTLSLRDFILNQITSEVNAQKDALYTVLNEKINAGRAIVLLDGLDEVASENDRAYIGRHIDDFVAAHLGNKFIVTSRVAGYHDMPLAGGFSHFKIREMGIIQIQKFLNRWCFAVEKSLLPDLSEDEIRKRAELEVMGIMNSIGEKEGVRRLASNPLMLTILALIHRNGTRLPSQRIELYELASKTLLEYWELARGIDRKYIVTESEALRILGPLAYWIHQMRPDGIISERETKEKIKDYLSVARNLNPDTLEVDDAADDFLRRVRQFTGVFVERAPARYGFMHLTFQEYYTAREIVRRRNEVAHKIVEYRHRPRWEEPITLAISFVSKDYPEDATDLIKTAILCEGDDAIKYGFSPSLCEDVLFRDLFFSVRVISDCVGLDPKFVAVILNRICNIYLDIEKYVYGHPIRKRMRGETLPLIGQSEWAGLAVEIVLSQLEDHNSEVQGRVSEMLGFFGVKSDLAINGLMDVITNSLDEMTVLRASRSLIKLGKVDDFVVSRLVSGIKSKREFVQMSTISAVRKLGGQYPLIKKELRNSMIGNSFVVRVYSAGALASLGDLSEPVMRQLKSVFRSSSKFLLAYVFSVFQRIGKIDELVDEFLTQLKSEKNYIGDVKRRVDAVLLLESLGVWNDNVKRGLTNALNDKSDDVRNVARSALAKLSRSGVAATDDGSSNIIKDINSGKTLPDSIEDALISTDFYIVRKGKLRSFRTFSSSFSEMNAPQKSEVIANLRNALLDTDYIVRKEAWRTLWNITALT